MRTYENKDELKNEINKSFAKYISEFNDIPEHLKDKRIDEIDRTPAENLAYQVGWTTLVIKWESDERKGIPVKTPSDNFKWLVWLNFENSYGYLHRGVTHYITSSGLGFSSSPILLGTLSEVVIIHLKLQGEK